VVLGLLTIVIIGLTAIFGLPLLIKFAVLLGEARTKNSGEVKEKILPPLPPRLMLPFEATNSSLIEIKGLAEKNIMVELLKNDVSIGKVAANDDGEFGFGNISLPQGESVFTAIAISEDGGSSEPSKELAVTYDDIPPELIMINPSEDNLAVDSQDFDIVGKSDMGVSVTLNGRVGMMDDEGKFKLKYQLNAGKNEIEIVIRDLAGNETRKKITITYDI